jgi:aerobic-type carbon monoxide dehydrogenase small subunit (CoxS/CutS family)
VKQAFALTVNGVERVIETEPETPLLAVLRGELGPAARFRCAGADRTS